MSIFTNSYILINFMSSADDNYFEQSIDKEGKERIEKVLNYLNDFKIKYSIYYHPPLPTIDVAIEYWSSIDATHCKNLFFRNHKGNKHYLVLLDCKNNMDIHSLEKSLKEGKLSFASESRMLKYLGVKPGSVSFFGLINDTERSVILYVEKELLNADKISFHPNDNRATLVISGADFRLLLNTITFREL